MTTPNFLLDTPEPLLKALERLRESFLVTDAEIDKPGPRILYFNPAFTAMTGYTLEELVGKSPRVLQGPDTDPEVIRRLRSCLENGDPFQGEAINYRKDGSAFTMRWYIEPIHDSDGRITHFFAIQRDITQELAEGKQRRVLEHAIGQLQDSMLLFGRDGRVRYANNAYLDWSARGMETVLGEPIWSLPGAPPKAIDLHWARKLLSQGRSWQREYSVHGVGPADEDRVAFISVSPILDADGEIIDYLAVGRDVTERRRLETIAEAHNFHDNLGAIFSGIRHELGNPINSIKTAMQVVIDNFRAMPERKLEHYLERIQEEVGRVEYLLRALRSYSLHDQPRFESIEVRKFLRRFDKLTHSSYEDRGVEVRIIVSQGADTIWADPQPLHQVLLNLLNNSMAALAETQNPWIELRATRAGDYTSLVVRDNGPGIAPENLPHVFKPFYTTRSGGTGLGLAISRHLLSMMRGTIDIISSSAGTEVQLLFDRQQPGATEAGP